MTLGAAENDIIELAILKNPVMPVSWE